MAALLSAEPTNPRTAKRYLYRNDSKENLKLFG